jgi:hypothetical protein
MGISPTCDATTARQIADPPPSLIPEGSARQNRRKRRSKPGELMNVPAKPASTKITVRAHKRLLARRPVRLRRCGLLANSNRRASEGVRSSSRSLVGLTWHVLGRADASRVASDVTTSPRRATPRKKFFSTGRNSVALFFASAYNYVHVVAEPATLARAGSRQQMDFQRVLLGGEVRSQ